MPDNYPDVRTVVSDTLAFLQNYPEKKVYWEIYARKAASKLFKDYGVFSSLTVTLVIHPDDLRAYLRTATATVRAASSLISASLGPGTGLPVSTILFAGAAAQANLPDVRIGAGGESPGAITYSLRSSKSKLRLRRGVYVNVACCWQRSLRTVRRSCRPSGLAHRLPARRGTRLGRLRDAPRARRDTGVCTHAVGGHARRVSQPAFVVIAVTAAGSTSGWCRGDDYAK